MESIELSSVFKHLAIEDKVAHIILNGPLVENLPLMPRYVVCWIFVFVEYTTISMITMPFIYRYLSVCR